MTTITLTAAAVAKLVKHRPVTGRTETWDAKASGLSLRVTTSGTATWGFRYRPRAGAGHRRITLGSLTDLSLADARERASRYRVLVTDGGDPQGDRMARRAAASDVLTFDALAERYIAHAKTRKSSWRNDAHLLERPRARWGKRDASSVSRVDVIALLDEIKATAPVSSNRTLSILVTLFNFAVEDQLLVANPISGLRKRATETPKDRVLSDAEMRVLWHGLEAGADVDIAAALKALLLLGQRPGEVAGAKQAEFVALEDERNARWEIPAARMKARRPHVVPLAPMGRQLFRDAMERRHAEGDATGVFASRFSVREAIARHTLSHALRRVISNLRPEGPNADVVRSLQERPPTPHDFRRTVASNVAALGVAREDRLAVFAHSTGDVHGAVYDKYERLREKRIALEAWERHLAELLGLRSPEGAAILPLRRGHDG
jgi:integrase